MPLFSNPVNKWKINTMVGFSSVNLKSAFIIPYPSTKQIFYHLKKKSKWRTK